MPDVHSRPGYRTTVARAFAYHGDLLSPRDFPPSARPDRRRNNKPTTKLAAAVARRGPAGWGPGARRGGGERRGVERSQFRAENGRAKQGAVTMSVLANFFAIEPLAEAFDGCKLPTHRPRFPAGVMEGHDEISNEFAVDLVRQGLASPRYLHELIQVGAICAHGAMAQISSLAKCQKFINS